MISDKLTLRPYQDDLVRRAEAIWADEPDGRIMLQLPTGGGKTEVAAALMTRYDGNCTFVPHTRGLVGQTAMRLRRYGVPAQAGSDPGGHPVPRVWKTNGAPHPGGIICMAVETWAHRTLEGRQSAGLLVIDEAHVTGGNGRRQQMIARHKGPILALTATPYRMAKDEDFTRICDHPLYGPSIRELIDAGHLADFDAFSLDAVGLRVAAQRKGESDDAYAGRVWREATAKDRSTLCETALAWWRDFDLRRADSKTITFALSLEHAHRMATVLDGMGYRARVIEGGHTGAERNDILADFNRPNADGGAHMLINVNLLREGFDAPEADILLCVRTTHSLALYLQMAGRVLRPKHDGRRAILLDLVDNALRHGLVDADRDWAIGGAEISDGTGEAPVMICRGPAEVDDDGYVVVGKGKEPPTCWDGGCGAINAPGADQCRHCGGSFKRKCSAEANDGCGEKRTPRRWLGRFRRHKMGACDLCGEFEADAQYAAGGWDDNVRLAWTPAKSGNGSNLRLAPPGNSQAGVWVGRSRKGATHMVWPNDFRHSMHGKMLDNLFSVAIKDRGRKEPREAVELALLGLYGAHGDRAAKAFGSLCPECRERLYAASRYKSCWECKQAPTADDGVDTDEDAPVATAAPPDAARLMNAAAAAWKRGEQLRAMHLVADARHAPGADDIVDRFTRFDSLVADTPF